MSVTVLIADDSAFMRNALTNMLTSDPEIRVIATARDGVEAVDKAAQHHPDVITMDVEMPRMDGLEALRVIMERHPAPVIMVSSLTSEGARETLQALELGAVDFIPKNLSELSINIVRIKQVLIDKVKQIAKRGVVRRRIRSAAEPPAAIVMPALTTGERRVGLVVIGSSTGGPRALQELIPRLPREFPVPIVIAQHMPASFTGPFAARLKQLSQIDVREAKEGDALRAGLALVAPGGTHMRLLRRTVSVVTALSASDEFIYRPSVDHLAASAAELYPGRALGVILTGMGNDGAAGFAAMKKSGSRIFAQNEESCVVYGMPKAVVEAGLADKVLPIEEMAGEIINSV